MKNVHIFGQDTGNHDSTVMWQGKLVVDPGELQKACKGGWKNDGVKGWLARSNLKTGEVWFLPKPNLVVNSGINRRLDRLFGLSGPPGVVDTMGVDNGTVNPSATTALSADGNSTSRRLQLFDATPTRLNQVVTCVGTFTQAGVAFVMKRLFLNATTTDASGNLHSMTNVFTIDLTGFSTWTQTFTATVTGTGS